MTKKEIVVFLLLAAGPLWGCSAAPLIGASHEVYVVWKDRESSRYYTYDVKTVCQAIKQSCDQLKLETVIQAATSENGCFLETKGKYPMEIKASPVEKNLTKVVVTIELFGDKHYAELLYRTVDNDMLNKLDIEPTTDAVLKTIATDKQHALPGTAVNFTQQILGLLVITDFFS